MKKEVEIIKDGAENRCSRRSLTDVTLQTRFVRKVLGDERGCFLAYAEDEKFRKKAASGGVASAMLCELLRQGIVQGVLIWRTVIENNRVTARPLIATDEETILSASSSKYTPVYLSDALPLIETFSGDLAAVLLPCDATKFRKVVEKRSELRGKVKLVVTLFCGHNSEAALTTEVLRRYGTEPKELRTFTYRTGPWRGRLGWEDKSGRQRTFPADDFANFQNLHCLSQRKCLSCSDHFGYHADISLGDVWLQKMRREKVKPTAVIIRTDVCESMFRQCLSALHLEQISASDVLISQARGALFHYNVSARRRAGEMLGMKINDKVRADVSFTEFLVALLALINYRISRGPGARLFFRLPMPIIRAYLIFFKGLEQLIAIRVLRRNRAENAGK